MKKLYILLFLIVTSFPLSAQEDDWVQIIERDILGSKNISYEQKEKKQTIGAARSTKSAEELPVTLYIISHDDIVRHGYVTLCDVLKNVPGIRVSQPAGSDLGEGFMQRGMIGNIYTKILINGVDVNPSGAAGMPLGANLPVRQAEKIEIVYGPASASYGNDACGGVINIVTKRPEDNAFVSADIMTGTGQRHYFNFSAGSKLGYGKHVVEFSIYGSQNDVQELNLPDGTADVYDRWNYFFQYGDVIHYMGLDITRDMVSEDLYEKYKDVLFKDMQLYFVNYSGTFSEPYICKRPQRALQYGTEVRYRGLSFSYRMFSRTDFTNHGVSPFTYNLNDPQATFGERINRMTLSGDWQRGNFTTNTSIHFIDYRIDENSHRSVNWDKGSLYFWGASDDLGIEENIMLKIGSRVGINTGASFSYTGVLPKTTDNPVKFDFESYKMFSEDVDFEYPVFGKWGIYPYTFYQTGAYLQTDYDLKPVTITAGVRYDYHSKWGSSVNPRIAALWKITDRLTLRASEGFAYKTPSPTQMYYTVAVAMDNAEVPNGKVLAYHHIPATGKLTPERISSTEVGLKFYFNKTNYLEVIGYTNRMNDPLVRNWVSMDSIANVVPGAGVYMSDGSNGDYIVPGYVGVGVTNLTNSEVDRKYTRAYANESGSRSELYGLQFIGVMQDIFKPIHLNIKGALTLTTGEERISANNAGETKFNTIKYVRGVPKVQAQFSFDFSFLKVMHFTADNIYCSETSRRYYNGVNNKYFWSPSYYNLDVILSAKVSKNFQLSLKVANLTNALYGGMDSMEMDVDLPYNPQLLRTITFGINYEF